MIFWTNRYEHVQWSKHQIYYSCISCLHSMPNARLMQWTAELICKMSVLRNSGCGWCQADCWIPENSRFCQINPDLRQMLTCPWVRQGKGHAMDTRVYVHLLSYNYFFSLSKSSTHFASCASDITSLLWICSWLSLSNTHNDASQISLIP